MPIETHQRGCFATLITGTFLLVLLCRNINVVQNWTSIFEMWTVTV